MNANTDAVMDTEMGAVDPSTSPSTDMVMWARRCAVRKKVRYSVRSFPGPSDVGHLSAPRMAKVRKRTSAPMSVHLGE